MDTDKFGVLHYEFLAKLLLIHRIRNGGVDSADNDIMHIVMLKLFACLQYLFPNNGSDLTIIHLKAPINDGVAAVNY